MILNDCGPGFCSCFTTIEEVKRCRGQAPPEWSGLCPFQDGEPEPNAVVGSIPEKKRVRQVRDALNKCKDPEVLEEIARLLRV